MIYVRPLDEREHRELKRLVRREVGRVSERIRMILLSSRGYSVPKIAEIFEYDEATVRSWIERYEAEGVKGLRDCPRTGRPCHVDAAAREFIEREVENGPAPTQYIFGLWTLVTLAGHLAECLGLKVSQATLRRVILALDFRWRRPRHKLPKDPQAAVKMWRLLERLLRVPSDAVILCADECDLHLLPVLRAMWMRRGHQTRIPTPGQNRKRSIFGALEWDTGRWTHAIYGSKKAADFIAFLEQLLEVYPSGQILIVLDNASIHKAKIVGQWLTDHSRIELLWLPTYSGHAENPVEKVWWRLKDKVAADRLHGNIDSLVAAAHQFFESLSPKAVKQLVA
ncbi:MAG: IS630 family transposase [Actinomycetota bacterium]|nr:IS630 family transposase [Actinomycetota bacterium]